MSTVVDMTGTGTDPRAAAFGFAQRRTWVFFAWWYPSIIGTSGAVYAGLSFLVGQDPGTGLFQTGLGAALAAVGWVITIGPRFTRKRPKPASDIPRIEQSIRITPGVICALLIVSVLGVAALALFTPKGASAEFIPVLGLLLALSVSISAGLAYTHYLLVESAGLYARWLARR
jgi:hypothetical protein